MLKSLTFREIARLQGIGFGSSKPHGMYARDSLGSHSGTNCSVQGARLGRIAIVLIAAVCFGCAEQSQIATPSGTPMTVNPAAVATEQLRRTMQEDQEGSYRQQQADASASSACPKATWSSQRSTVNAAPIYPCEGEGLVGSVQYQPAGVVDPSKSPTVSGIQSAINSCRRKARHLLEPWLSLDELRRRLPGSIQVTSFLSHFRDFSDDRFRRRSPGPPPFSSMKSAPAALSARRITSRVARC